MVRLNGLVVENERTLFVGPAAQRVIERHGFSNHIMPFNYRPLQENEVYSCEPGIYIYGVGGFRQDDTVVVGKARPEVITKRSKRLEDQTIAK